MNNKKYRAVLLDIDGTLLPVGSRSVSRRVIKAAENARAQGVKIIVATGRSDFVLTQELLGDFAADFHICVNGGLITDAAHQPVRAQRFDAEQMALLAEISARDELVLAYTFEDNYYFYHNFETFVRTAGAAYEGDNAWEGWGVDCPGRDRHLKSMPYGGVLHRVSPGHPLPDAGGLTFVRFATGSYDVYRTDVDKARAAEWLLARLGIGLDECVAVGDGNNDVPMLTAAGLGVAMGNARPAALAAADRVTASAEEDGVAVILEELFG